MNALGLKVTNFHYPDMTFNKVGFVEYPKWIHMSGYPSEIAPDAETEARLLARTPRAGDISVELQGVHAEAIARPILKLPK